MDPRAGRLQLSIGFTRAGMQIGKHSPVAYTDRRGNLILPFDEALELGRKFCAAEPSPVLVSIESTERDWAQRAQRGEDYIVSLLNGYRASWALIRQWAGLAAALVPACRASALDPMATLRTE